MKRNDPSTIGDLARRQQIAVARAFEMACVELDIGQGSLDVWKSERLGRIMSRMAASADWNPDTLAQMAVAAFLSETNPTSPTRLRYGQ
jgi:hypothetical protein